MKDIAGSRFDRVEGPQGSQVPNSQADQVGQRRSANSGAGQKACAQIGTQEEIVHERCWRSLAAVPIPLSCAEAHPTRRVLRLWDRSRFPCRGR